ncbi:MAG: carboxypeptidase-like regulatory domain-containing protein, partial [Flavisolibacter sp.]|nr:carboxypeptidase-like regulatory domain-containing protein [Flavisolibacter sp.]
MRKYFFFLLLLFISIQGIAQSFVVSGKITNNRLEPLAFVSIQLKQSQVGTITKEDGSYTLKLDRGTYDLMISMVGYKDRVLKLTVTSNYVQNIILDENEDSNLEDIVIRVKIKDRSEEIIRNVIRNK